MSKIVKIIVDPTGWKGQEKNPYTPCSGMENGHACPGNDCDCKEWEGFEYTHSSLSLTEYQEPGSTVEARAVWRECLTFDCEEDWIDCLIDGDEYICSLGYKQKKFYRPVRNPQPLIAKEAPENKQKAADEVWGKLEKVAPLLVDDFEPFTMEEEPEKPSSRIIEHKINKYARYIDNLQWYIDTNKPKDEELLVVGMRINTYKEILSDLKELIKRD